MELPTGNFTEPCGTVHLGRITRQHQFFIRRQIFRHYEWPRAKGPIVVRKSRTMLALSDLVPSS
jgi:hypothetical protein